MRSAVRLLRTILLAASVLALPACEHHVLSDDTPEVQLATTIAFAGGEVVLVSERFIGDDTLPVVLFGSDTVRARFAPPDTVIATAPQELGTFDVRVVFPLRWEVPVGSVLVGAGFVAWWEGPPVYGHPVPWPGGDAPTFIAEGADHLLLIDPRTLSVQPFLDDTLYQVGCSHGPGYAVGGGFVLHGRPAGGGTGCGDNYVAYRGAPVPQLADSGPGAGYYWLQSQFAPGDWMLSGKHQSFRFLRDSTGTWHRSEMLPIEEPEKIVQSPRGDLAVPSGATCYGGVPVFRVGSLLPAYFIEELLKTQGAQFSDDGDTLYLAGYSWDSTGLGRGIFLTVVRTIDGKVVRSVANPVRSDDLLIDPGRRWVYLVGEFSVNGPMVQVFDRETLRLVATMEPPVPLPPNTSVTDIRPILSPVERRLYLVGTIVTGYPPRPLPMRIFTYRLLD